MASLDKLRILKVEDVTLWRRGERFEGSLTLTQHHIIFSYVPLPAATGQDTAVTATSPKPRELWITYPMIALCTYRPAASYARQQSFIRIRCRDFTFVAFHFVAEPKAREAFEHIRNLSCRLKSLDQLYAFSYKSQGPERKVNGWTVYNAMEEWRRQGVGKQASNRGWRITDINKDYQYSPTYPAVLAVPSSISDNVLNYAGKYRSRTRIPVLTYLHPVNECSISRSSQPLVGVRGHRSVQDEKLVGAIFSTSKMRHDRSRQSIASAQSVPPEDSGDSESLEIEKSERTTKTQQLEDSAIAQAKQTSANASDEDDEDNGPRLYGAQQSNLIVDARPTVNAFAMQAVGLGSENMDNYPFATKAYLGIDNIHVMRSSLNTVIDTLKDSDVTPLSPDREKLAKSGWLKHISNLLDGAALIARQVGIHHSHVLIHCSDGWDRTGQLSALSQLCLDPYYRTIEGFIVLVEKDFLSFGHMFRHRSGFMSHEKWFEIENDRSSGMREEHSPARKTAGGNAFENALLSAKGFFNKHSGNITGREHSAADATESELVGSDSPSGKSGTATPPSLKSGASDPTSLEAPITKPKEISPVFHQFLDATYQLLYQHPTRFEFNERFLRRLLYQLYSCQYGTFLYDNERSRVEAKVTDRTHSVWDYFLARKEQFTNEQWDKGVVDDNIRGKERLLFPSPTKTRWWAEVFGRTDDEMNGVSFTQLDKREASALAGLESSQHSFGPGVIDEKPTRSLEALNGQKSISGDITSADTGPAEKLEQLKLSSQGHEDSSHAEIQQPMQDKANGKEAHSQSEEHPHSIGTEVETETPSSVPHVQVEQETHEADEGDPLGVMPRGAMIVNRDVEIRTQ